MFQNYQMMLNRMMVEQMKLMRKQMKFKDKSKKIYNLLYDLAKPIEEQDEEEVDAEPDPEEPEEPEAHFTREENTTNYFQDDYKNKKPVKEISAPKPKTQEPEQPQYKQEYEQKIDQMGGFIRIPSRRDRLNFKNFNI